LLQANNALLNLIGTDRALVFVVDPGDIDQLFLLAQERAARYQTTDLVPIALAQRPDYQQSQLQRQQLDLERQLAVDQQRWQVDAIVDGNLGDGSRTELGLVARRTLNDPQLETGQVTSQVRLQQQDNTLTQQQDQIRNDVTTRMGDVAANQRAVSTSGQPGAIPPGPGQCHPVSDYCPGGGSSQRPNQRTGVPHCLPQ
jgi:hypothetical protein